MKINLHIERLVLEGLPVTQHEGPLLQAALETELTRLLVADGLSGRLNFNSGVTPRVAGSDIRLTNDNPIQTGEQIARAVHGGINQ